MALDFDAFVLTSFCVGTAIFIARGDLTRKSNGKLRYNPKDT